MRKLGQRDYLRKTEVMLAERGMSSWDGYRLPFAARARGSAASPGASGAPAADVSGAGPSIPSPCNVPSISRLGSSGPRLAEISGESSGSIAAMPSSVPSAWRVAAAAADVVWLDALVMNVDRSARNPNLLLWHERLWLIDHGAALYLQHGGLDPVAHAERLARELLEFFQAGQLVHIGKPEAHEEILRCAVEDRPADHRLASRRSDQTFFEKRLQHAGGVHAANLLDFRLRHRLLVGDHGEGLKG